MAAGLATAPEAIQRRAVLDPARAHVFVKQERRAQREIELGAKQLAWPTKIYGVFYADPPWSWGSYSQITGMRDNIRAVRRGGGENRADEAMAARSDQEPAREPSRKPDEAYKLIESYFPTLPKIELFARGEARPGWDVWGNEVARR